MGFVVGETHVVTCAHVVNAALGRDEREQGDPGPHKPVRLEFSLLKDTPPRVAHVAKWLSPPESDQLNEGPGDVALLEMTDRLPTGAVAATLDRAIPHTEVEVFGYLAQPQRSDGGWVKGELLRPVRSGLIQVDASLTAALNAQPGFSGSAVFDRARGKVVGMLALASVRPDQRDYYAIPDQWLRDVCTSPGPRHRVRPLGGNRAVEWVRRIGARWMNAARTEIVERPKRTTAIGAVLVAGTLVVSTMLPDAAPPSATCPPPLELRVLSSPEGFPGMAAAASEYADRVRDTSGCRRVHFTVYHAGTDAVLRGFAGADSWAAAPAQPTSSDPPAPCPGVGDTSTSAEATPSDPGREIGPRPDIWFPDSSVDVERAQCVAPRTVQFSEPTPVAWSPLVLGVPRDRRAKFPTDQPQAWDALKERLADTGLNLARPNPETSTGGLVHTAGLYQSVALEPHAISELENSLSTGSLPLSDSVDLLCHLATASPTTSGTPSVLVSEASMVNYNLNLSALPNCLADSSVFKYDALYPSAPRERSKVLALDHPFVHVTWTSERKNTEPDTVRAEVVRSFQNWLLSDAGQRRLSLFSLRSVRDVAPDPNSPLLNGNSGASRTEPPRASSLASVEIDNAIKAYDEAHEPGRVAFLVDVSWSMTANGNIAVAKGIVESALGLMGKRDEAALTTVPKHSDPGDSAQTDEKVPLGQPSSGRRVHGQLASVAPLRNGVALYDAIDRQLTRMTAKPGPAKQTLVVITTGEDDYGGRPLSTHTVDSLLARHADSQVTVHVVALPPASCGPGNQGLSKLATALRGRCTSVVDNRTSAALVAGVW